MKLRFLRTKKEKTYVVDYGWMNFLNFLFFFEDKKFTRSYCETTLQVLENGKWIDVPIIDVDETK
jgi:predicted acetyltransferase